jgi:hypothetical protein
MGDDRRLATTRDGHPLFRPGNIPMLAGLSFVNGYSSMQPRGLRRLLGLHNHGWIDSDYARRLLEKETRSGALLDHLGVDGLVLYERLAHDANLSVAALTGWHQVATIDGEILLHRSGDPAGLTQFITTVRTFPTEDDAVSWVIGRTSEALPFFVVDPGPTSATHTFCEAGRSTMRSAERMVAVIRVDTTECPGDGLLLLRRPWFPGYRATTGGQELRVVVADLTMPAVVVPPGLEGDIRIEYRPQAFRRGVTISLAAFLLLGGLAMIVLVRRLRNVLGRAAPR